MENQTPAKINPLKALEQAVANAREIKDIVKIDSVKNRHIANYEAITGRTDGMQNYEKEAFALIQLANNKPEIMECDPFSIMAGFIRASSYGLSIDSGKLSIYKQGVKIKNKDGSENWKQVLVVKPDAHGKKELLQRMPSVKRMDEGVVVFKNDTFKVDPRKKVVTVHEQAFPVPAASKDTVIAAYVTIHFTDGHTEDVWVSIDEIEKARAKSKLPDGMMWKDHYGEACKKTVYNRAYKVHYIQPDSVVLYKQYETKESESEYEEAEIHEPSNENIAEPSQANAETVEEFRPDVNEQTGEVYEPEPAEDTKKKKRSREPFI